MVPWSRAVVSQTHKCDSSWYITYTYLVFTAILKIYIIAIYISVHFEYFKSKMDKNLPFTFFKTEIWQAYHNVSSWCSLQEQKRLLKWPMVVIKVSQVMNKPKHLPKRTKGVTICLKFRIANNFTMHIIQTILNLNWFDRISYFYN